MDFRSRLLWVDGGAGFSAGILMLALNSWLSALHNLPSGLLLFIGIANVVYGMYSLTLASRSRRPAGAIWLLITANSLWVIHCLVQVMYWWEGISIWGILHLGGEGIIVGTLAFLEWRWRHLLWTE